MHPHDPSNTNKRVSAYHRSHKLFYLYREDNTYYWQHCRKEAEDDLFVDADGLQLDILGDPVFSNEWILGSIIW